MSKKQATDTTIPNPSVSNGDEPKTWLRVADGIWQHIPSGIYYERPTINGSRPLAADGK